MTNAIASERKRKGLTQTSLGNMIGKDRSTIGRWESNPRVADCGDLEKLADIFDCSVDYLLGRCQEDKAASGSWVRYSSCTACRHLCDEDEPV